MIVVIGNPAWRSSNPAAPTGRAADVAVAAARRGARVELVGRIGDDSAGDALVVGLSNAGVGHVALLRDPARPTLVIEDRPDRTGDDAMAFDAPDPDVREVADGISEPGPGPQLEPEDAALGLQYLTAFEVLVVADGTPGSVIPVAAEAAAYAGAQLVVLVTPTGLDPVTLPVNATVLAVPTGSDDGAFANVVGAYVAALDAGVDPGEAFAAAAGDAGWERQELSA